MERVRLAIVVDRPLRGDECLAHDLAPEHPLAIFIGTSPRKMFTSIGSKSSRSSKSVTGPDTRSTMAADSNETANLP